MSINYQPILGGRRSEADTAAFHCCFGQIDDDVFAYAVVDVVVGPEAS